MKKNIFKIYQAFCWMLVFVQIISIVGFPAMVKAVSLPTAAYVELGTLEDALNNMNTTQPTVLTDDQLREKSNAEKTINGPQVTVKFDSLNVQPGQLITAEAKTTGFTKGDDSVYFTWFLKHDGCGFPDGKNSDDDPNDEKKSKCDADEDGKITVNDWKVEAMRIIARGDFDSAGVNYGGTKTSDQEKADGYEAYFGNEVVNGTDADDAACYFQDYNSGRIFELNAINAEFQCPTGFHQQCVDDVAPKISCTYENPTFNSLLPESETNIKTITEEKNVCKAETSNSGSGVDFGSTNENPVCKFENSNDIDIFKLSVSCADTPNKKAVCVADNGFLQIMDGTNIFGKMFAQNVSTEEICRQTVLGEAGQTCTSLFSKLDSTANLAVTNNTTDPNASALAKCDFKKGDNVCKHLFPKPENGTTGDGKFEMTEEKFWGTNPKSAKTAGNQNVDEANVVGLGMNKFAWEYRTGDKVGVVVEGAFTKETQHGDGTKMTMWALPNNMCSAFEEAADENKTGFYTQPLQAGSETDVKILAVDFDVNDCLEENLLDPSGNGKLQVDLTYSPTENLINDPEGGVYSEGSVLNVSANVSGFSQVAGDVPSLDSFYYKWKVEVAGVSAGNPPLNSDSWIDITSKLKTLNPTLKTEGIGMQKFELPLSIPTNLFLQKNTENQYIRIKAEVAQIINGGEGLAGKGTVILKINNLDKTKGILMFPVNAENDGKLRLLNSDSRKELCDSKEDRYLCYVTENEIVGLMASKEKLANFSWTLNGKAVSCGEDMSSQCTAGNIIFFPARELETEDGLITVKLNARDVATGEIISVSRYFKITQPSVAIDSADYTVLKPKLFGFYKGLDGSRIPDYSNTVYETSGGTIKLKAVVYPQWKATQAGFDWYLGGMLQPDLKNQDEIEIDTTDMLEVNVDLNLTYNADMENQINNMRKALYKYWDISPELSVEDNNTSASMRIEINNDGADDILSKGPKSVFGAMLTSHLATQALFTLRLVLTAMLIVFIVGLVFALMPGTYAPEKTEE